MKLEYNGDQFNKALRQLKKFSGEYKAGIENAVMDSVILVQTTAKRSGYVPKLTGHLMRSITHDVDPNGNKVVGKVGTNVEYASIQEFGGIIRAKKSKYLVFKIGGQWIKTPQVRIKGKRYLTRAVEDNKGRIAKRFQKLNFVRK